jgi:hypothetical protein
MPKYTAKGNYRSTLQRDGRNEQIQVDKGKTVELDEDVAEFIKRDCPGILVRAKGTTKTAARKKG